MKKTNFNRKSRKYIARELKYYLELNKIPNAREETIEKLCKVAKSKSDYEKYSNW